LNKASIKSKNDIPENSEVIINASETYIARRFGFNQ
jgi:hypothetical protein